MAHCLILRLSNNEHLQYCLQGRSLGDYILAEKQEIGQNIYRFMFEELRTAIK